jgi:uncharacterized membrane protein YfcA
LKLLLPIALATTPIGTAILAASSETVLRFGLSLTVLLVAVLFLLGFRIPGRAGPGTAAATGAVAGVMNGVAAMAGPPMVFFYLSRGDIAIGRATIVAFFGITDGAALIAASSQGLITTSAMVHAAAVIPPLLLGAWIGERLFRLTSAVRFRRVVLWLLVVSGGAGVLRALWGSA